jgi:hypothetical protein
MSAMRRTLGPASRATSLCVATTLVLLTAFATPARAETPPASTPHATTTPAAPPATTPAPPPPGALEAGDTATAPGAPPATVEPLGAPGTGPAPPGAPSSLTATGGLYAPVPIAPRREPFYRQAWFWGVCGVAIVTLTIIGVLSLQPIDPAQPTTRLGDMRAF